MSALNRCGIYTVADVAKLAGISKRNAEEWQAQGIIRSTVRSAGIRGRERLYCFADLFAVHLAASLRLAGTPIATIVKAVDAFYSTPTDGDRHYLIIVGDKASIVSCTEAQHMLTRGVHVQGANLLNAAAELRAEIDRQLSAVEAMEAN